MPPPFAFADAGHPLFAALEPLREIVDADPGLRPTGARGEVLRADLRVAPAGDGTWAVERLYWSAQRADPGAPGALRGRMLVVDRRRGRPSAPTVHDFPDDPRLPAAARSGGPLVAGHGGGPVLVLRYIPLGRITFRTAGTAAGHGVIGKIKAPRSLERAQARLEAVRAAAARPTFAVPAPLGIDAEHHVWFQSLCPGRTLAELVGSGDDQDPLRRLGAMHREVHALDVDAPPADEDVLRAALRADAAWIALAAPEHASAARHVHRWLEAHLRHCGAREGRFCHGDYSPSQILCDGDAWTVLDFDDAHRGDPYADVAATLVSLEHEIEAVEGARAAPEPAAVERRGAAYLAGYGDVDERRLLAHRVAASVSLLARRLRKDRAAPDEPGNVLESVLARTGA
jgi:aminoglycoside phosphotransferase (APT) family kinase protein